MSPRFKILPLLLLGFSASASPSMAAIVCSGNFQIVNGKPVSTPFCQDEELAASLRRQGERVSGDAIRNSTELRTEACALTGPNSTSPVCADSLD
jgi:hypothetical protein